MTSQKFITHAVTKLKVTAQVADLSTKTVTEQEFIFQDLRYSPRALEKAIKGALPPTFTLISIISTSKTKEVRAMPLEDFIKHSTRLEPKSTVTETEASN